MIVIKSLKELPEKCIECPCYCHTESFCQADDEQRSSEWRPFWCPLGEVEEHPTITFPQTQPYYPCYPTTFPDVIYCDNKSKPIDNLKCSDENW